MKAEQMHQPVNPKSLRYFGNGVSLMTRVGFEPTTYGLKVPATARTYSSDLVSTEYERPRGLSVHVPKRPTRNAPPCQSHVSAVLWCEPDCPLCDGVSQLSRVRRSDK